MCPQSLQIVPFHRLTLAAHTSWPTNRAPASVRKSEIYPSFEGNPGVFSAVGLRHRPIIERLVEDRVRNALFARHLAEAPPGGARLLDDLARPVVADVRVERRRRRERQLGVALALLPVRLDAVDALLTEQARSRGEELD